MRQQALNSMAIVPFHRQENKARLLNVRSHGLGFQKQSAT